MIERAAILAAGSDSAAVIAWITAHAGIPEAAASSAPRQGLHGARIDNREGTQSGTPLRFVLPAGALA